MLEVTNLETGYSKKRILNSISLEVDEGEIIGIIGNNGAGKSTLLKSIFGLLQVWRGVIEFNGRQIQNRKPIENVKNGMSYVMQGNRVFNELSVLENLEIGGYLQNSNIEMKSKLDLVFELFPKLKERKKQNAGTLSGGEKQMLALANTLLLEPKMLLLDEPSLGLSPNFVQDALRTIQSLNSQLGISILIVEQKVREVLKIVNKVYVLKLGEVVFEGKPEESLSGAKLQEFYLS